MLRTHTERISSGHSPLARGTVTTPVSVCFSIKPVSFAGSLHLCLEVYHLTLSAGAEESDPLSFPGQPWGRGGGAGGSMEASRMGLGGYWMNGWPSRWLTPPTRSGNSGRWEPQRPLLIRCPCQQNFVPQSQPKDQSQPICPPWCPPLPAPHSGRTNF